MTSQKHRFNGAVRNLFLAALACLVAVALTPAAWAQQNVDDEDIFELDGNAENSTPTPAGDDWHTFFPTGGPSNGAGSALIESFATEGLANVSIFTQGGSKDINGIGQWRHTDGSVPPKDQLENAFAAAYQVGPDLLLYFGADRYANNGDANLGMWFLQSDVGLNPDGTFSGEHVDGDIFVVSGFTSGGQTSELAVYTWTGDDATGSLTLVTSTSTDALCVSSATGAHTRCAITNSGGQASGWDYTPKSGSANTYPVASFFEGGINVTQLLGGTTPCFSTFILETRSSTSETAQLKDFILGNFSLCGIEMTKACPATVNGTTYPIPNATFDKWVYRFGGIVKNTGVGALHNVTVTDTFQAADTTSISPAGSGSGLTRTYNVGTINGGQCVTWPFGNPVACATDPNTLASAELGSFETFTNGGELDRARVDAALAPGGTPDDIGFPDSGQTVTATCPTGMGTPAISVSKNCSTTVTTGLSVTVSFTGEVCNQSGFPVTNLTASDIQTENAGADPIGSPHSVTLGGTSLASCPTPGTCTNGDPGVCVSLSGSYSPSEVSGGTNACNYFFEDKVSVMGDVTLLGTSVSNSAVASCDLCPCDP